MHPYFYEWSVSSIGSTQINVHFLFKMLLFLYQLVHDINILLQSDYVIYISNFSLQY